MKRERKGNAFPGLHSNKSNKKVNMSHEQGKE